MVMVTKPENRSPRRPGSGPNNSDPLYPIILATVVIGSILTTAFTAARLITKRLVLSYEIEDCECQTKFSSTRQAADILIHIDMLFVAWVSICSAAKSVFTKMTTANAPQVAGIAFSFVLLAAGLAGLGDHIWYLQETQFIKLDQVR